MIAYMSVFTTIARCKIESKYTNMNFFGGHSRPAQNDSYMLGFIEYLHMHVLSLALC